METTTLQAELRQAKGTKQAQRERDAGRTPAIIYGHKQDPVTVSFLSHDIDVALHHGARLWNVDVSGKVEPCLVKDIQFDWTGSTPIHLDLIRVNMKEKVKVLVDVELKGVPKGASEGGVLEQMIHQVEVECLVTSIPESIHLVVAEMHIGDALHIKDIAFPEGVTATGDPEERVVLVKTPRGTTADELEEGEGGEGGDAAEPEVIGRGKQQEEGGE